jgi:putative DNA (cytosine-5-)-methyltransferase
VGICKEWRLEHTPTGDSYKLAYRPRFLHPAFKFKARTYIGVPEFHLGEEKIFP